MTAPRAREQADPPSPPDRLPSPRGGHPSPSTASAAGRPAGFARLAGARRGLVGSARALAAAALLALFGGLALLATAQAQTTGICDRTQQVQDEILRQLSAVSDCAAVTVADLATVTELSLEDKSITSLKAGDFDGLTAVWKINLNFNQLGALPANLFSGLTSLTWLEVQESGLTSLPADAFSGLTALTSLFLDGNRSLGSLPANLFSRLTSLRYLALGSIGMTELPAGLFSGLSELEDINLTGNELTSLPAGVFSGLSKLDSLQLGFNLLTSTSLPDGVRAKVLAGAPFAVDIPVTVVDGTLAGGATTLRVKAGSVEGDPEFGLDAGGPRLAGYESGSGTDRLVFAYRVQTDDRNEDGIWIGNHNHATNRTFRLDGNDRIRNAEGDEAELTHDELGRQSGHKVDGSQKGGMHSHPEFDHAHPHYNTDKRYYTQKYAGHTHASHEHSNTANNHSSSWKRPGGHHHHEQEEPNGTFLGPDLLKHDGVEHTHVCMDIKPTCNQGANFYQLGDELGLPIEFTHAHANSEPGHGFDWMMYFENREPEPEATPTPRGLTATPGNKRVTLAWNAPAPDSGVTYHEYRYKTSGDYPAAWTRIANSAPGETHASGFTVTSLVNGTAYTFELRAGGANGDSDAATSDTVTPTAPPRITGVAVTSTPELDGDTYGAGDDIRIEVTFDQPVRVEGDPEFGLDVGGPRVAGYRTGSGSEKLVFVYTVQSRELDYTLQADDRDRDGIWIGTDVHPTNPTFRLDGDDRIANALGHQDAVLAHGELGTQTGHKVDGSRKSGTHSHPDFTHGHAHDGSGKGYYTEEYADHRHASHVHDDAADDNDHPSGMRPGQHHHHEQQEPNGTFLGPDILKHDEVTHTHVCMDINPGCNQGDNFNIWAGDLGLPIRVPHAHANSEPGHRYDWEEYFEDRESEPPLMGRFDSMPERHDGTKRITAKVTFSEPIDASEEEMSEHGVQVEGGRVRSARRAPADGHGEGAGTGTAKSTRTARIPKDEPATRSGEGSCGEPGSTCMADGKAVWEFEIEPDSEGDVTVRIDAGGSCDAPGAICTADGRSLSEGIAMTVEGPEPGPPPLTASFEAVPEAHDGEDTFHFRVAFSEEIGIGFRTMRDESFTVDGGEVTRVRRVDGRHDLWRITVAPDGEGEVTVTLPAGRACAVSGAICTRGENRRQLTNTPAATVAGPLNDALEPNTTAAGAPTIGGTPQVGEALTASTSGISDADGLDTARFAYQWIRTGVDIGGATASTYTPVAADEGERLQVWVGFTDDAGHEESLTSAGTAAVAAAASTAEPLTARFVQAPAEHDGETAFKLRIAFSEGIAIGFRTFRDQSVSVSGGSVTHAKRVDRRKDLWKVTVKPGSRGAVTVTLAGGRACGTAGAVCTGDGRALSAGISTTVLGPAALTVADARAKEGTDETIDFTVSLSRATRAAVTVAYATADGTATAGSDYTATSGTLTFAAGETEQTVSVPVLDDAHDEGEETLTLRLSAATGAVIADGVATGTIKNTDHLQRAWLARFGRTAATHVTDAVGDRLRGTPGQGSHLTVGGYRLPLGQRGATGQPEAEADTDSSSLEALLTGLAGVLGLGSGQAGGPGTDPWGDRPAVDPRLGQSPGVTLDLRRLLLGSSFRLSLGAAATGSAGPRLTAWGRVAGTTFDGREGDLSLNGDVLTGTVGVDGAWDRLLAGLAVAHSRGDGSFTKPGTADRGRGELENTLTSVHPYLRYAVNDRLAVWGVLGYGTGHMEMAVATGETRETDMALVMGAFGGRGILLPAGETGGFELATRTDAMLTRTSSDAVAGMVSADAEAHRLRLVLEGSRGFAWPEGRSLTPTMEVGLRHDWGDAETGFGLELGGRVHYADPALGLTIEAAVRGLLAHEDDDYQEWGASGSLRLAPGAGGQGLSLTLAPTWGAASSGVNGLWSRQTTAGLAPQTPAGRLNAEVGYGFAPFDTGLLTPYAGTVLSDGAARTYRVGGRLQLTGGWATGLTLNLEGTRQEPAGQQPLNQGLRFQLTWGF